MEVGHLLTVALDGLGREFLLRMLRDKLRQEHRERLRWRRGDARAGLSQITFLLLFYLARDLRVRSFLLRGVSRPANPDSVLAGGAMQVEFVEPDYFP